MKRWRGIGGAVNGYNSNGWSLAHVPLNYPVDYAHLVKPTLSIEDRDMVQEIIELSECPCDPRRRHERLGQKVAVV